MGRAKKKMGAPKGNKNAEKWTEETVLVELEIMKAHCTKNKSVFIGSALSQLGYGHQLWSEWTNKFKDTKIVFDTIKNIEKLIESNLVEGGVKGDFNSTMTIFTLKNKHGWQDKRTQENTGANGGPIKVEGYTLITPNED